MILKPEKYSKNNTFQKSSWINQKSIISKNGANPGQNEAFWKISQNDRRFFVLERCFEMKTKSNILWKIEKRTKNRMFSKAWKIAPKSMIKNPAKYIKNLNLNKMLNNPKCDVHQREANPVKHRIFWKQSQNDMEVKVVEKHIKTAIKSNI